LACQREQAVLSDRVKALHVLDQVLGGPACAEHLLVECLAATREAGDDEAGVRAEPRGLYAGDELALLAPLAAPVGQLMEATYDGLVLDRRTSHCARQGAAISRSLELMAKPMM
jgi:hypothetical protein